MATAKTETSKQMAARILSEHGLDLNEILDKEVSTLETAHDAQLEEIAEKHENRIFESEQRAMQPDEIVSTISRMRPHSYYMSAEQISECLISMERCTGDRDLAEDLRVLAECVRNLPQE